MKVDRLLRINEMMQRELGALVERRIAPYVSAMVTVVKVKISPDLQVADIVVSVYGKDEQKLEVMEMLRKNRVPFQNEIGRRIKIKFTPILKFHLDEVGAKADRILALIDELHLPVETAADPLVPADDQPAVADSLPVDAAPEEEDET